MVDEDATLDVTWLVNAGNIFLTISSSCALTLTLPVIVLTHIITSNMFCGFLKDGWGTLSYHIRFKS
eukprot:12007600-Prorocentrum_lima.AAC.1